MVYYRLDLPQWFFRSAFLFNYWENHLDLLALLFDYCSLECSTWIYCSTTWTIILLSKSLRSKWVRYHSVFHKHGRPSSRRPRSGRPWLPRRRDPMERGQYHPVPGRYNGPAAMPPMSCTKMVNGALFHDRHHVAGIVCRYVPLCWGSTISRLLGNEVFFKRVQLQTCNMWWLQLGFVQSQHQMMQTTPWIGGWKFVHKEYWSLSCLGSCQIQLGYATRDFSDMFSAARDCLRFQPMV